MQRDRHARRALACEAEWPSTGVTASATTMETADHPVQLLQGVVVAIEMPAATVRVVRIRTHRPLLFSPGQYAKLRFVGGLERSYSIASVGGDDLLEFHISVAAGEAARTHAIQHLRIGDGLGVSGPHGSCYLRRGHDGPIICVGGGTGLAPMLSIVRGALETGQGHPVHLYYGEKVDTDVYAAARLADLESRYPRLTSHIVIDCGPMAKGWRPGPVTAAIAADWSDPAALSTHRAYVSGSSAMACAVRDLLSERGLAADRMHSDSFSAQAATAR